MENTYFTPINIINYISTEGIKIMLKLIFMASSPSPPIFLTMPLGPKVLFTKSPMAMAPIKDD
jgi:hypothetical protein